MFAPLVLRKLARGMGFLMTGPDDFSLEEKLKSAFLVVDTMLRRLTIAVDMGHFSRSRGHRSHHRR